MALIKKDTLSEFRNSATVSSIILFSFCTVFIIVKSFDSLEDRPWSAMIWILLLFSCINAMVKSFIGEGKGGVLFNYFLYNPLEVIVAKIIFNTGYGFLLFSILYLMMTFFLGNQVLHHGLALVSGFFGVLGISTIFSFIAMIGADQSTNSSVMMSVLALPLTLPIVLTSIHITSTLQTKSNFSAIASDLNIVLGVDLLLLGVVCLLFNELWQS